MTSFYFIPGTMCDRRLWHKVEEKLEGREIYHCTYSSAETLEEMQDCVLQQAPKGTSHLVGFSLGGFLAMMAAMKEPQLFKSLTIIAASPTGLSASEKKLRQQNASMLKNFTYKGMSHTRLAQFVHPRNIEDTSITGTILTMEKDLGQEVLLRQLMAPLDRPDLSNMIEKLPFPVTFIMAVADQMVSYPEIKNQVTKYPNIQLHSIKDCGHMIPLEAPAMLGKLLAAL